MILTLDIGNSEIMIGGFESDEIIFVCRITSDMNKTSDEYAASLGSVLALYGADQNKTEGAIISSVVPGLNSALKNAVKLLFGVDALVVGPGIRTGIGIKCDIPSSVGADLISASVAAHYIYGSPSLIVDVGTATKMTVVEKNGAFIGTSIIPGILMGLEALSKSSALLPNIELCAPGAVIAKNTADCMRSGIIYGNASMIDGMIDRIFSEYGEELPVIVTGSQSHLVIPHLKHNFLYDGYLVLKGLNILFKKNN